MSQDCIFCKIAGGEVPATVVHETANTTAFKDLNPQAPVHVLIIPRTHIETVNDLDPTQAALIGEMVLAARQVAADKGIDQTGYRLVWNCLESAGQSVFHLHLHLLGGRRMQWPPG
jgi:histidine triad (HIT) family protein